MLTTHWKVEGKQAKTKGDSQLVFFKLTTPRHYNTHTFLRCLSKRRRSANGSDSEPCLGDVFCSPDASSAKVCQPDGDARAPDTSSVLRHDTV